MRHRTLEEKEAGSPGFADTDVVENNHVSKNRTAPAVLNLKTLLNHAQPIPGFVYDQIEFLKVGETGRVDVSIRAHGQSHPKCSKCLKPCPGYDRLPARSWLQVPLWNMRCQFHYAPRRVDCPVDGIVVEKMPWCEGKRPLTLGMMAFLAMWARRLSWLETARAFKVSWEAVFRSVEYTVDWGLEHRVLSAVKSLGIGDLGGLLPGGLVRLGDAKSNGADEESRANASPP